MYNQQRRAIIKSFSNEMELTLDNDNLDSVLEFSHKSARWKLALVEPLFQSQLGVNSGDTILLRQDMLSKGIACYVADFWSVTDVGTKIIRISDFAKEKLQIDKNNFVLVEKWEKIFAKEIIVEYFINSWSIDQQLAHDEILNEVESSLPNQILNELNSLPISVHDVFETNFFIKGRANPLLIDYWVRRVVPDFPIISISSKTRLVLRSRARRLKKS